MKIRSPMKTNMKDIKISKANVNNVINIIIHERNKYNFLGKTTDVN